MPPLPHRRNDLSAKHWHNKYAAWQVREKRQAEERERLEAEKMRIFGGNMLEGDDDGCAQGCWSILEGWIYQVGT